MPCVIGIFPAHAHKPEDPMNIRVQCVFSNVGVMNEQPIRAHVQSPLGRYVVEKHACARQQSAEFGTVVKAELGRKLGRLATLCRASSKSSL